MLSVLVVNYEKTTPFKDKVTILQSATNLQLLQSPDQDVTDKIIVKIKLLLEDCQSRLEGLMLLYTFLSQSGDQVFETNAFSWAQSVLRILQGTDPSSCKELSCSVLKTIIINAVHFPELRKNIGEKMIPSILGTLVNTMPDDQWLTCAIDCLASCMKILSGYCFPFKTSIENFLANQLDRTLNAEIELLAKCYWHLPLICERSANPTHFSKHWNDIVEQMIGSLQKILNFLYCDFAEAANSTEFPLFLPTPPDPENEFSAFMSCSRQFHTISSCLANMLCNDTNFTVNVPVSRLLLLIDRSLSVSYENLSKSKISNGILGAILPTIHSSAFIIVEAVILACPDYLIVQEGAIGKLLFRSLKTQYLAADSVTEEANCILLRSTTYRAIRVWVEKLHPVSLENLMKELIFEIKADIKPTPKISSVKGLSMPNYLRESSQLGGLNMLSIAKSKASLKITACLEALQLLSSMLYNAQNYLSYNSLKVFHDHVVDILLSLQYSRTLPAPYDNGQCRLQLYKVFLCIIINAHNASYSPLSLAMTIFRNGQADKYADVSRMCRESLAVCMSIVHPERVIYTSPEKDTNDSVLMNTDSGEAISNIDPAQSNSNAVWESVSNSAPSAPSQVVQGTTVTGNLSPEYITATKTEDDDQEPATIIGDVVDTQSDKEEEEEYEDEEDELEEDEVEEIEDVDDDDDDEEEDDEDEDEEGEEDDDDDEEEEEEEDIEDLNDLDCEADNLPNQHCSSSVTDANHEDNSNSNINGYQVEVVNENGFDASDDASCNSVSEGTRKRKYDDDSSSEVSPTPKKTSLLHMEEEKSIDLDDPTPEMKLEDMLQDFVNCSPEDSKS